MVKDIFAQLGGAIVVKDLMGVHYQTAWMWKRKNAIPARHRVAFVAACKKHGITVTLQQLSAKK